MTDKNHTPHPDAEPRAVSFPMLKGGFGKSMLASTLTAVLGERNHDVLLIDLDPAGHLSTGFGYYDRETDGADLNDVLLGDENPEAIIRDTEWGFDFIPSQNLEQVAEDLSRESVFQSDMRLKQDLVDELLGEKYDYILHDLPGTRNKLTNNAIVAAPNIILPLKPVNEALNGLRETSTKLIAPLRKHLEVNVLAATPNALNSRIDQRTTDRELLEAMNQSEQFAAYLEAGREGVDPDSGYLPEDMDLQDVLSQYIPPYARITAEEWDRIDSGEYNPSPGIRDRKAFTHSYRERVPVTEYEPTLDQLEHFHTLAEIVEVGGVQNGR